MLGLHLRADANDVGQLFGAWEVAGRRHRLEYLRRRFTGRRPCLSTLVASRPAGRPAACREQGVQSLPNLHAVIVRQPIFPLVADLVQEDDHLSGILFELPHHRPEPRLACPQGRRRGAPC